VNAKITITDADGNMYEGEVELVTVSASGRAKRRAGGAKPPSTAGPSHAIPSAKDFNLPIRAFMNRYAKACSGHAAFALLVARLTGGKVGTEVRVEQVRTEWSKMTGLLNSRFAPIYGTRAKDNAWVDSPSRCVFVLLPDWAHVFRNDSACPFVRSWRLY